MQSAIDEQSAVSSKILEDCNALGGDDDPRGARVTGVGGSLDKCTTMLQSVHEFGGRRRRYSLPTSQFVEPERAGFLEGHERRELGQREFPCFLGWFRNAISMRKGRLTVAKLIYSVITSLDGYVADEDGNFDWAAPDQEVHTFVNDLERPVGTYLYGRRMYDVMVDWETAHTLADQPPFMQDFAEIWQAADKIVYSKTLETVSSARTRIERDFNPEAVRRMKALARRDVTVGGPDLAAQAIKAGLVDEFHLFVAPIVVGGGKQSLPNNVRLKLELLDERRFGNGVVHLHYRTRT
jgi:dihydrofolate reductase